MTLNSDLIRSRCAEIEDSLNRLEEFRSIRREAFLENRDMLDIACYRLLIAMEAALALCFHVSAKHLHQVPEEYAGCFEVLQQAGILPADLTQRLQHMARFRNLLVHVYWKVDYEQIYDIIQDQLADLRAFSTTMAHLL